MAALENNSIKLGSDADESKNLVIKSNADGSFVIERGNGTDLLTINASGVLTPTSGLSFGNETLSAYEEGTFTPVIEGVTTAGVGTYSAQQGVYVKVGKLVTFHLYINWSAHTGTGNTKIVGLPFNTSSGISYQSIAIGQISNFALTASNTASAYTQANTNFMLLVQSPVGGGAATTVPLDTAASLIIGGSYITN